MKNKNEQLTGEARETLFSIETPYWREYPWHKLYEFWCQDTTTRFHSTINGNEDINI